MRLNRTTRIASSACAIIFLSIFTWTPSSAKNRPLTIMSEPPGAQVEFNGRNVGVTPLVLSYDNSFSQGRKRPREHRTSLQRPLAQTLIRSRAKIPSVLRLRQLRC